MCCDPLGCTLYNSKLNIVHAQSTYATECSDTCESSSPIIIVDKTTNAPTEAVVNGNGINAVIAAMPYFRYEKRGSQNKLGNASLDLDQMAI